MTVRALNSATAASEPSTTPDQFRFLPLSEIDESATNPRATCSADALNELAASIRLRGVLQPILVRAVGERYELIAGARRLRASVLAGLTTIPARVVAMDDQAARETPIIENLQREDVHPLEEAEAYERLDRERRRLRGGRARGEGRESVTYVYTRLTLARLIPEVREVFRRNVITAHAQRLATVPPEQQPEALRQCFIRLLSGADSEGRDRHNLAPVRQVDDWLRTKVALNVHHEDTKQLLPELASDVAEQVEAGAQILALSTLHFQTIGNIRKHYAPVHRFYALVNHSEPPVNQYTREPVHRNLSTGAPEHQRT